MGTQLAVIAPKLSKLIAMLASPSDGEVVAAARAMQRTLTNCGLTLNDLAETLCIGQPAPKSIPVTRWRDMAVWCRNVGQTRLSLKEFCFVCNLADRRAPDDALTFKQQKWLSDIEAKLRGRRH